jgi:hypothetical protein
MLRSILVAAALAAVGAGLGGVAATARPDARITVVNRSHAIIFHIADAPANSADWSVDLLAEDVIFPGEATTLVLDREREVCRVDLRVVIDDGTAFLHRELDACTATVFEFSDQTMVADALHATGRF